MKKYYRKKSGFTLLELLVSLAVLGILISAGVAAYSGIFAQQALLQKTERLYHFLSLAKSQAVKQNQKIFVHFCPLAVEGAWKMAMSNSAVCDCSIANSCLLNGVEVSESLSDGKTLFTSASDITFSGDQASYSAMRFSVNAGSVTLSDVNDHKLKVIQSIMRLRICSPDQARLGYKKC